MNKKTVKLKSWVSVTIYLSLICIMFVGMLVVNSMLDRKYGDSLNLSFILKDIIEDSEEVVSYTNEKVIKPFDNESVSIEIDYYDKDKDSESQKKSLILYENTYMPNTGILYSYSEQFNVLSTLDGKVTKIKEDELLGRVVEITHDNNLVATYYSIDNLTIHEGQEIKQGDIIGTSGKNNISSTSDNQLLFEISINGQNMDPKVYYDINLKDLGN